jgi:hypothetical protein
MDTLEGKNKMKACKRIIIQIDSILKLPYNEQWDLMAMDESESMMRQLVGCNTARPQVWSRMLRLASTARKFLPMDALADTHTYNLLQLLDRPCVPYWRKNTAVRNEGLDYWFERDERRIMGYIASVLHKGRNVCIPSASASAAVSISKTIIKVGWVNKSEVLVVTAMTPPEEKRIILKNFKQHIKENKFRVVIFSLTITAGCDISGDYFHAVVALVGVHSVTPHDMWQMTQQVRDPGVIVFWLRKMPLKPNEVSRVPLWRTLKVLNKPQLAWRVLNKTGKVF